MNSCFADRTQRMEAFKQASLYLVISSEFTENRPVPEIFEAAAAGGIRLIQLRDKSAHCSSLARAGQHSIGGPSHFLDLPSLFASPSHLS